MKKTIKKTLKKSKSKSKAKPKKKRTKHARKHKGIQQEFNDILITLMHMSNGQQFEMVNMGDWSMDDLMEKQKPLLETIKHLETGKMIQEFKDQKKALQALAAALGMLGIWCKLGYLPVEIRIGGIEVTTLHYFLERGPKGIEEDKEKMAEQMEQLEQAVKDMETLKEKVDRGEVKL